MTGPRAGGAVRRLATPVVPSVLTIGNLLCGWAAITHTTRGDLGGAAPFIALAIVFDVLDGRVARLTGTTSALGAQLDSLADLVSFGVAPALLAYRWGLQPLGALGWVTAGGFLVAAAVRLARFNVHADAPDDDGRYFRGLPSPAAAALVAATVLVAPDGLDTVRQSLLAVAVTAGPAVLMVSTLRFRSFKGMSRPAAGTYRLAAAALVAGAFAVSRPHEAFLVAAYAYLTSGFIDLAT